MAVTDPAADANAMFAQLTEDYVLPLPEFDLDGPQFDFPFDQTSTLYDAIPKMSICDLTSGEVGGTGVFDSLMKTVAAHLQAEFSAGRITGAEYTKSYIAAIESSMGNGTQFLLQKDAAFWQAQTAQLGAITARVQLQTAKAQLIQTMYGALTEKAKYALLKMQATTASIEYRTAEYNHSMMQPLQKEILEKQSASATLQIEGLDLDNQTKDFTLVNILPTQRNLLSEQMEAARAQTLDVRSDGTTPVVGSVGKQKDLYAQQITSYQRKSELDAARLWSDAWTVQKTIDEGLTAPTNFTNTNVDSVLAKIRTSNGLT